MLHVNLYTFSLCDQQKTKAHWSALTNVLRLSILHIYLFLLYKWNIINASSLTECPHVSPTCLHMI